MQFMPLMWGFFFWNLSSGVVLYWLTSNMVGMGQQWFFNKTAGPVDAAASAKKATSKERQEEGLNPKYSVHETGPRIEQFLRQVIADGEFELDFAIEAGRPRQSGFRKPRSAGQISRSRCRSAAGESRRASAGSGTGHAGISPPPLRRSFAHFFRCERLPGAAHRRTASERSDRGRESETHRHAIPLQSDEQPRAARDPHRVAQRERTAQRKRGRGTVSPRGDLSCRNAVVAGRAASAAAAVRA